MEEMEFEGRRAVEREDNEKDVNRERNREEHVEGGKEWKEQVGRKGEEKRGEWLNKSREAKERENW